MSKRACKPAHCSANEVLCCSLAHLSYIFLSMGVSHGCQVTQAGEGGEGGEKEMWWGRPAALVRFPVQVGLSVATASFPSWDLTCQLGGCACHICMCNWCCAWQIYQVWTWGTVIWESAGPRTNGGGFTNPEAGPDSIAVPTSPRVLTPCCVQRLLLSQPASPHTQKDLWSAMWEVRSEPSSRTKSLCSTGHGKRGQKVSLLEHCCFGSIWIAVTRFQALVTQLKQTSTGKNKEEIKHSFLPKDSI